MASILQNSTFACPLPTHRPPPSSSGTFRSSNTIPDCIPAVPRASPEASGVAVRSRNLILCFDGTGDKFDADNSNVVRLFSTFKKDDPTQRLYYQSGIGTYSGSSHLKSGISAGADMAVGSGLGFHVRGGYEFLQQNYQQGDRICLFGFSRGAYTARALAGMLHKVGLLPAWNTEQIPFAYEMYKKDNDEGWALALDFKKTFCIDVGVYFLGVWDTVASVGFIPRQLPYAHSSNSSVRYFRHALALDERRAKFKQNHWIQALNHPSTLALGPGQHFITPERLALEKRREKRAAMKKKLSIVIPPPFRSQNLSSRPKSRLWDDVSSYRSFMQVGEAAERDEDEDEEDKGSLTVNTRGRPTDSRGGNFFGETIRMSSSPVDSCSHQAVPWPLSTSGMEVNRRGVSRTLSWGEAANGSSGVCARPTLSPCLAFESDVENAAEIRRSLAKLKETNGEVDRRKADAMKEAWYDFKQRQEGRKLLKTDVLEVWFAGCHCDVGGGAVPNGTRHQLARVPLRWMIRQTFLCNTGILYDAGILASLGLDVHTLHPVYLPRRLPVTMSPAPSLLDKAAGGSLPPAGHSWALQNARDETESPEVAELNEEAEDYFDAMSPMLDMLNAFKSWWILELFPIKRTTQNEYGEWVKKIGPNMGRHRSVRDERPKVHYTVLMREAERGYKLKNETDVDGQWQIVI